MKKIYSKITKERRKEFQIETCIMKDGEQRLVVKRALAKDGVAHIRKMSDYYEKNKDEGILCPSKLISENEIAFEFLTGESLCNTMLEALEDKDEVRFLSLLRMYDGIIRSNVNIERRTFMPDAQFVQVFGEVSFPDEMECGKEMNIDMSFDNIIKDQTDSKYKIIDYEWVFSFPIPVKFVIYRAVSAFYTRNGSAMKDIMTINEIYDCFDITEEEIVLFENMNEAFNQYVYGGKNGYNASLIAYKKEVYDVKKLLPEENLFLQVFLNDGTNYLEDKAITNHIIGQNVKLNIPIEFTQDVSEIRLDPLNVSCVLQNLKVQIVTKDNNEYEIEHYRHNAIITKDHDFIFASEDPQIIFENQWENNVREIKIAFRIREAGLQDNPILSALSELKCHMDKVENELEYIKGTKVYKTLLERKVDKVLGENE